MTSPPSACEPDDGDRDQRERERQCRAARPVEQLHVFVVDQRRHDLVGRSAQHAWRHQCADGEHEDEDRARQDAGRRQRQGHREESVQAAGAERRGRRLDVARHVVDCGDEHENHERQIDVSEADDETGEIEHQLDRARDQAEIEQKVVDEAVAGEQRDPSERANHQVQHHRKDHEKYEHDAPARWAAGDMVGKRIAEHETQARHRQPEAERAPRDLGIVVVGDDLAVVLQRP
jgi:hypothetical protein